MRLLKYLRFLWQASIWCARRNKKLFLFSVFALAGARIARMISMVIPIKLLMQFAGVTQTTIPGMPIDIFNYLLIGALPAFYGVSIGLTAMSQKLSHRAKGSKAALLGAPLTNKNWIRNVFSHSTRATAYISMVFLMLGLFFVMSPLLGMAGAVSIAAFVLLVPGTTLGRPGRYVRWISLTTTQFINYASHALYFVFFAIICVLVIVGTLDLTRAFIGVMIGRLMFRAAMTTFSSAHRFYRRYEKLVERGSSAAVLPPEGAPELEPAEARPARGRRARRGANAAAAQQSIEPQTNEASQPAEAPQAADVDPPAAARQPDQANTP